MEMTYPLPQMVGPLDFVQNDNDKDESSENAEECEGNIRNQPADQSSQSDQSDAENASPDQKIHTSMKPVRGLPILAELDLSPVQERLAVQGRETDIKHNSCLQFPRLLSCTIRLHSVAAANSFSIPSQSPK